jgi:hypothetical protein
MQQHQHAALTGLAGSLVTLGGAAALSQPSTVVKLGGVVLLLFGLAVFVLLLLPYFGSRESSGDDREAPVDENANRSAASPSRPPSLEAVDETEQPKRAWRTRVAPLWSDVRSNPKAFLAGAFGGALIVVAFVVVIMLLPGGDPRVDITSHKDGDAVPADEFVMEGTSSDLPADMELWVVDLTDAFYVNGDRPIDPDPSNGNWRLTIYPGVDTGTPITFFAVLVSPGTGVDFTDLADQCTETECPSIEQLPDHTELDRVSVTVEDSGGG